MRTTPLAELPGEDALRASFDYDPLTGEITRKASRMSTAIGRPIRGVGSHGYVQVSFRNAPMLAHRLAWFLSHGRWPVEQIDHINGIRTDNRLSNLRECTVSQNLQNCPTRRDNKIGLKGVHERDGSYKRRKKYTATIKLDGKIVRLGNFASVTDAHEAYKRAADKHFGAFARHE